MNPFMTMRMTYKRPFGRCVISIEIQRHRLPSTIGNYKGLKQSIWLMLRTFSPITCITTTNVVLHEVTKFWPPIALSEKNGMRKQSRKPKNRKRRFNGKLRFAQYARERQRERERDSKAPKLY